MKLMRNFITAIAAFAWCFYFCDVKVSAATSSTRGELWASVVPTRAVYEVHGARVVLTFTLVNSFEKSVDADIATSKLLINNIEVNWRKDLYQLIHTGKELSLKSSEIVIFETDFSTEIHRLFRKPGIYNIQWVGKRFKSPEVSIHIKAYQKGSYESAMEKLIRLIRLDLLTGWEVTYSDQGRKRIEITRWKKAKRTSGFFTPGINTPAILSKSTKPESVWSTIGMTFWVEDFLAPVQYRWRKDENEEIEKRLEKMRETKNLPTHKGVVSSSFSDHTKDAQVAQYQWLRGLQQSLPDFYFDSLSFSEWDSTSPDGIEDVKVRREYDIVRHKLLQILKRYEAAK